MRKAWVPVLFLFVWFLLPLLWTILTMLAIGIIVHSTDNHYHCYRMYSVTRIIIKTWTVPPACFTYPYAPTPRLL